MQDTNTLHMTIPWELNQFSVNLNNKDIWVNNQILLLLLYQKGDVIIISSNDKFNI